MKVELSIADDRELRRHIRDVIKGEVLSIARGEIKSIIAEAVQEKVLPGSEEDTRGLVKSAIKAIVKEELGNQGYTNVSWIKDEARKQIAETIREWATSQYKKPV